MKEITKNLDLTICIQEDEITVHIYEPESGEVSTVSNYFSPDVHPMFDEDLGEAVYSWISLWKDEMEESE